jgi:hypothetical protein
MLGSGQTKKGETGEEESHEHAHHFDIKEIVYKEFVLAGQTVNSTLYCHILQQLHENIQTLRPKLWQQTN